jgi:hypothetical protein
MLPNDICRCRASACPSAAVCARTEPRQGTGPTGDFSVQIPKGADKCGAYIPSEPAATLAAFDEYHGGAE